MSYLRILTPANPDWVSRGGTVEAAFRANAAYLASLALRLVGRESDVEDLLQDIYLAAVRHLRNLDSPHAVKQWFATATIRLARRRLRRYRLFSFFGSDDHRYEQIAGHDASPEQRALLAAVYRVLARQPADCRLAWSLRHMEGMDLQQVADACRCSLATAKRRIARAQAALTEALGDE